MFRFGWLPGSTPAKAVCESAYDTRSEQLSLLRLAFVWLCLFCFGFGPAEAQSLRHSAAVAAALGCVPHGQWALLDADILIMIDPSACLVEPVLVSGAVVFLPVPTLPSAPSTSSAASGLRTQHFQRRVRSLLANIPTAVPSFSFALMKLQPSLRPVRQLRDQVLHFRAWILTGSFWVCFFTLVTTWSTSSSVLICKASKELSWNGEYV